jgi:hypothetical protein
VPGTRVKGATAAIDGILRESGAAFLGATGGGIGVVMGKMLVAGGKALQGVSEIRTPEFRLLLTSMETSVAATGKVKPGTARSSTPFTRLQPPAAARRS